jgi:hypothetical protein
MKRLLPLALLSAVIFVTTPAAAEMSANQMIEYFKKDETSTIKVYFRGLHEAYAWSNTALNAQSQPRLYCEPASVTLTDEQSFDIMRRSVETNPSTGTSPAPMVLLLSLQAAFPCPKNQQRKPL